MNKGERSLKSMILRAAGWTVGGMAAGYVLRIASNLIMTRILVPEMFGIMAVSTVILIIVNLLSDVGLRQSIIQSPKGDLPVFLNTAWTLQVIRGVVIWLACLLVALALYAANNRGMIPADLVYATPELPLVLAASSFSSVITGLQSTKAISRDRHLDLRQITYIELISQAVGLAITITLGLMTRSIWSFVIGSLASCVVSTALSHFWLSGAPNRLLIDRESARELIQFGRWILISSLFSVLAQNGDRVLLGAWISPVLLGIYVLAYNLISMIEGAGGRLFWSVSTPAFSHVVRDDPSRLKDVYFKFRLPMDLAFVASAGLLYGAGQSIIDIMYDSRYAQAGAIVQVLSFSLLISRFTVAYTVYIALGVPRNLTVLNICKAISMFVVTPLAQLFFGFEGTLWAIALHGLPTIPIIFFMNRQFGLNDFIYEAKVLLIWPVGLALGMGFAYAANSLLSLS